MQTIISNKMSEHPIVKKLEGKVNKTLFNYNLIENGDKVMVGLSGGKDSYSLLSLLISRRKALPIEFELHACHVMATDM
ncbi:MAG TPA: tRNA 2-thiocytidine(32) synthetase TtcA, partial [Tenuifilaceae bacterium]|nr:tRNA 2-thiocytidine(32) synthetase TtcA [Tenuifilaceae bacterium]